MKKSEDRARSRVEVTIFGMRLAMRWNFGDNSLSLTDLGI